MDCLLLPTFMSVPQRYYLKNKKKNHYKAGQALQHVAQTPTLEQSLEHLKFSADLALRKRLH